MQLRETTSETLLGMDLGERFALLDEASVEGVEELLQIVHLLLQVSTYVRIGHQHTVCRTLRDDRHALDILHQLYRTAHRRKGLVLHQLHTLRIIDQCVACDACTTLISSAKAPIDDHQLATSSDRFLALGDLDRHVSIDDVTVFAF